MIVLRTEVEVAEEDGGFSTRDHQDQEHDEQEPEHIVDLVSPYAVEDEVELNENAAHR